MGKVNERKEEKEKEEEKRRTQAEREGKRQRERGATKKSVIDWLNGLGELGELGELGSHAFSCFLLNAHDFRRILIPGVAPCLPPHSNTSYMHTHTMHCIM
jgi:hypothetical protein